MGTLVVIERDPDTREQLAALGRELGFAVRTFSSGKDGAEHIKRDAPEIALVSASLGDMSGYDVSLRFAYDYSTAIIIMVDTVEDFAGDYAMSRGVAELIVKPVRVEEMRCRIARARELHTMLRVRERLVNELERLSQIDGLTGLLNARVFFRKIESETRASAENSTALSLLMLDLDHFKQLNDKLGHSVGNHVLQEVGAILRSCMTPGQNAFRYGGEEFAVLLRGCDQRDAAALAEDLRERVAKMGKLKYESLAVSVSVGVGQYDGVESHDAFIQRVDAALYDAKAQGRNRVVVSAGTERPQGQSL